MTIMWCSQFKEDAEDVLRLCDNKVGVDVIFSNCTVCTTLSM